MPRPRAFRELRLLYGSTGDPRLFVDDQGQDNALLIDCGDNAPPTPLSPFAPRRDSSLRPHCRPSLREGIPPSDPIVARRSAKGCSASGDSGRRHLGELADAEMSRYNRSRVPTHEPRFKSATRAMQSYAWIGLVMMGFVLVACILIVVVAVINIIYRCLYFLESASPLDFSPPPHRRNGLLETLRLSGTETSTT